MTSKRLQDTMVLLCWLILLAIISVFRLEFKVSPFQTDIHFQYPELAVFNPAGGVYLTDTGSGRLLKIDYSDKKGFEIPIPSRSRITSMSAVSNGDLYLILQQKETNTAQIFYYSFKKNKMELISRESFIFNPPSEIIPGTLQFNGNDIYFMAAERTDSVGLFRSTAPFQKLGEKLFSLPDLQKNNILSAAGINPGNILIIDKQGKLFQINSNLITQNLTTGPDSLYNWNVSAVGTDRFYISDPLNKKVWIWKEGGSLSSFPLPQNIQDPRAINSAGDGSLVLVDDRKNELLVLGPSGDIRFRSNTIADQAFIFRLMVWLAFLIWICIPLMLLILYLIQLKNDRIRFGITTFGTMLLIVLILNILLSGSKNKEIENSGQKLLSALAASIAEGISFDSTKQLEISLKLKQFLNGLPPAWNGKIRGVFYLPYNDSFFIAADSTGDYPFGYPMDGPSDLYQKVLTEKKVLSGVISDRNGRWLSAAAPVLGENGQSGVLELSMPDSVENNGLSLLTWLILITGIIGWIAVFSAYLSGYKKTEKLAGRLISGLERLGDRDYDVRILEYGDLEGPLAEVFNSTARSLKEYTERMKNLVEERSNELYKVNSELHKRNLMMKRDLITAQKVQDAIIPKEFPKTDMLRMSGIYMPMDALGGDYYDVIKITNTRIAIVMADVSGHGVSSAMITAMARVSFSNNSKEGFLPGTIMKMVNRELCVAISEMDNYLSAFYGIIDMKNGILEYSSAGHNDVYLLKANGELLVMSAKVPFIGKFENLNFPTEKIALTKGDKIILFTDGITEARNETGGIFGYDKLREIIINNQNLTAQEFVHEVIQEVEEFKDRAIATDDRAILVIDILTNTGSLTPDEAVVLKSGGRDTVGTLYNQMNNQPQLQYKKALDLYKADKIEEARIIIEHIHPNPDNAEETQNISLLKGSIYMKLEKWNEAFAAWMPVYKLKPNHPGLAQNILFLKKKIGHPNSSTKCDKRNIFF